MLAELLLEFILEEKLYWEILSLLLVFDMLLVVLMMVWSITKEPLFEVELVLFVYVWLSANEEELVLLEMYVWLFANEVVLLVEVFVEDEFEIVLLAG